MTHLAPSEQIETHLQRLLSSGLSLQEVTDHVLKTYSRVNLNLEELRTISHFLLQSGYHFTLVKFLLAFIDRGFSIPWPYFCEALFVSTPAIPESIKSAIVRGADSQTQLDELARTHRLDHFDDRMVILRQKRPQLLRDSFKRRKEELIATLEMLQAQGLQEEEERLLEKFALIFPNDADLRGLQARRQKRRTIGLVQEIKSTRDRWIPILAFQKSDPESERALGFIEASMQEVLNVHAEMSYDFAVAHVMWENYAAALRLTESALSNSASAEKNFKWLHLEILFQLRRYVDILTEINALDVEWANDPDATFALLYLRATCLWELTQKQQAIELMESLCIARPQFRSARILLAEWRGEAT